MDKYLTEEQIIELKKKEPPNRKSYPIGCLHSSSLEDGKVMSENMDFDVAIVWYRGFKAKANMFAKIECPICHKVEVLPYFLGASILSGSNEFRGYCFNCHTRLAFNHSDYYHFIRDALSWKKKNDLVFATYSIQNDKTKLVEDLYSKINKGIDFKEADKVIISITGTEDMTLNEVSNIYQDLLSRFDNEIEVELKTNVKSLNENEIIVKMYGYKKG